MLRLIAMTESPRSAIIKAKPTRHGLNELRDSFQSLSEEIDCHDYATTLARVGREGKDANLVIVPFTQRSNLVVYGVTRG